MKTLLRPSELGQRSDAVRQQDSARTRVQGLADIRVLGSIAVLGLLPLAFPSTPVDDSAVASTASPILLPEEAAYPAIPLEVNERVEYWINRFTTDQRPTFELFLTQEGAFGKLIRDKLRARSMPDELIYLAMIESGLRPQATSRVEAAGVWQFMGPTAQAYGLRVDPYVDERRDPVKATDAALDYLDYLHDRYQSWYLSAAAYNAGPTRINRILRRAGMDEALRNGADGDSVYWEVRHLLPRETREYVPRMLAAAFLANAWHESGFGGDLEKESPYEFDRVWVPGGTTLGQVAEGLRLEQDVVWALNPHLVRGRTPPDEAYPLRVPVGSAFQVVAWLGGGRTSATRALVD